MYAEPVTPLTPEQIQQIVEQVYQQNAQQNAQHKLTKMYQLLSNLDFADQKDTFKNFKVFASRFDDYDLFDGGLEGFFDNHVFAKNSLNLVGVDLFTSVFHKVVMADEPGKAKQMIEENTPPENTKQVEVVQGQQSPLMVSAPVIGLSYQSTTGVHTAKYYKQKAAIKEEDVSQNMSSGVILTNVVQNTLFHNAGFKQGDFIYEIGDVNVDEFGIVHTADNTQFTLNDTLSRTMWGDTCEMSLLRPGVGDMKLSVCIEPPKNLPWIRTLHPSETDELSKCANMHGIMLAPLRANHLQQFSPINPKLLKYASDENMRNQFKLIIQQIDPNCVAFTSDILIPGLLVKEINGQAVPSSWERFMQLGQKILEQEQAVQKKMQNGEKCEYTFSLLTTCNRLFVFGI